MSRRFNKRVWTAAVLAACVTAASAWADAPAGDKPKSVPMGTVGGGATLSAVTNAATTQPAAAPATTRPAPDGTAFRTRLQPDMAAFGKAFPGTAALTDPAVRQSSADQVVPAGRKLYADFEQMAAASPRSKAQAASMQSQLNQILSLYGDADATARIKAEADNADPAVSVPGQADQLLVQWWSSAHDATAQAKVADAVETLAKAHPESGPLTRQMLTMGQIGAATPALKDRVAGMVSDVMRNPTATAAKRQLDGQKKLAALAGKPMTVAGPMVDGKPFTSADYKGKVVLVDFWATWCGPCRAELPRVKQMYDTYHAKGLEIIGVSNDFDAAALADYTAKNGMPWTELFDATAAASNTWNPLTQGYGINGIPTMFLIDKAGVCRSVTAREDMEKLIPTLLAE
jgi:thiol-disulfide isomerase/thioredoxin